MLQRANLLTAKSHVAMQARQATIPNRRLQGGDWLADVAWDADEARQIRQPLLLDVNDPNLIFELRRGADLPAYANAAATILPPRPKVNSLLPTLHTHTHTHSSSKSSNVARHKTRPSLRERLRLPC